ncbi:hypothetical protein [Mycolicibacterium murale]|jgi:hypothetical protein|uniref:Uncharacterized protein n=1 Tax=Mycolicibacterium tokaiense TaxID=39695 RepID=A0A378TJS3_9MYCO|nr:hypothetical protein [Mycolicibacterium murale]STZ60437.1 Uncharacterised protein [Mycolicibacterium tokaiense]
MRQTAVSAVVLFRRGLVDGGDWRLIAGDATSSAFLPIHLL